VLYLETPFSLPVSYSCIKYLTYSMVQSPS